MNDDGNFLSFILPKVVKKMILSNGFERNSSFGHIFGFYIRMNIRLLYCRAPTNYLLKKKKENIQKLSGTCPLYQPN